MEPDIAERPPAICMTSGHPVAVPTGLEPATSGLTGRRELQTSPRDHCCIRLPVFVLRIRVHFALQRNRTPNGIRTRAATLKGWCPRPLDDGGLRQWPLLVESDQNLAGGVVPIHRPIAKLGAARPAAACRRARRCARWWTRWAAASRSSVRHVVGRRTNRPADGSSRRARARTPTPYSVTPDTDRDQHLEAVEVEPRPQPEHHDRREHHREPVVAFEPRTARLVVAAVQPSPDAVHHESVGQPP